MRSTELHYELPAELVARYPAPEREQARLLLVDRGLGHHGFRELCELLPPHALLVLNDTRVIPARLLGRKRESGGKVELLLVRRLDETGERWTAMVRSSRPLRTGAIVDIGDKLEIEIEGAMDGLHHVKLRAAGAIDAIIDELGHVPLPPYIGRPDEAADRERYQTVYARVPGAVAAPTAGLHFSSALLEELVERGIELARLTLHVGPGTFRPITSDDLEDHQMHAELFEIPEATAAAIEAAKRRKRAVVAVGTTVVRALESAADEEGVVRAMRGDTQLYILPGYRFRVVDALVTNFHLPGSTLLALVYAFGGVERIRAAYSEAIARRYRFYSYGDAMLVTPQGRP